MRLRARVVATRTRTGRGRLPGTGYPTCVMPIGQARGTTSYRPDSRACEWYGVWTAVRLVG
jgi:hypothetical protein